MRKLCFLNHIHMSLAKFHYHTTKMRKGNKTIAANPNVVDNSNSNTSRDLSSILNPAVRMNYRTRPPPFLAKLYSMVMDPETNDIISWSPSKQSFIIWDRNKFSSLLLPKYFKQNNFPSFRYQLNNYGFNKINWEHYEFANPLFVEGREDLLMRMRRKNEENKGVVDQRNDNLHGRSVMEATMEILGSEQQNLELQLQELREKQEYLLDECTTVKDNIKATLEDQQSLNTALIAHLVHQYVTENLKDHRGNDETQGPASKILRLASPDNHLPRDSPDQEDPTLDQTEVTPVTTPLDNSGRSTQGQKTIADDSAFWKKIMEDGSS